MNNRYEPNCDKETVESLFRMINEVERTIEKELDKKDALMRMLAAEAGKTFEYEGKNYQVCERYNKKRGKKVPFFKYPAKKPIDWLGRVARSRREDPSSEESSVQTMSEGLNVGDSPTEALRDVEATPTELGVTPKAVVLD